MLSKASASEILSLVGVQGRVTSLTTLSNGTQHDVMHVTLENQMGTYVIKSLSAKGFLGEIRLQDIELTEQLSAALHQQLNCNVVSLNKKNQHIQSFEGKEYLVYPYQKGEVLSSLAINQQKRLAALLANMHNCNLPKLDLPSFPTIPDRQVQKFLSQLTDIISGQKATFISKLIEQSQVAADIERELVLSHRDLNLTNIIWRDQTTPLIIDWELAGPIDPYIELIGLATNLAGITSSAIDVDNLKPIIDCYKENLVKGFSTELIEEIFPMSYLSWLHWLRVCLKYKARGEKGWQNEISISLYVLEFLSHNRAPIISMIKD